MIQGHAVRAPQRLVRLHLGDHLVEACSDGEIAAIQSAVALLRTVYEDHYVDPDHKACLFFHGCTVFGLQGRSEDFTVVHREGRVVLSEFTAPNKGPEVVSLPLYGYAAEVLRFAEMVLTRPRKLRYQPEWQSRHIQMQWEALNDLVALTRRFIHGGGVDYEMYCAAFTDLQGQRKRPLELQVTSVLDQGGPFEPVTVEARVAFGPIRAGEVLPMRINRGDVVRVTASNFTTSGVILLLEGIGSGGVCRGDALHGLQFFYP
jgi:hypothetical protein